MIAAGANETSAAWQEKLLAKIGEGDSAALAELYEHTRTAVYGYILSILRNPHDAEDVLHDLYVTVWSSASSYRPGGKPMAWILTIAKNLCLMKKRRAAAEALPEDWESTLAVREGADPDDRLMLEHCMNELADDERSIVMLHAVSGLKHREIAELMDMALPTVLSKYSRAIKKLRKMM